MKKNNFAWLGLLTFLLLGFSANSQNVDVEDSKKEFWIKENSESYKKQGGNYIKEPSRRTIQNDIVKESFVIHKKDNYENTSVSNFNDLVKIRNQNTQEYKDLKDGLIKNSNEYYELNYSPSKKLSVEERNQLYNNPKQ